MSRFTNAAVVSVMAVGLLGGCANIQDDGTRTRTEGTLAGTGGGAAIGALLGNLFGGDSEATMIGAGIGALIGAGAGYFYGDHVATEKAKYASTEEWLDACIAQAREVNQKTYAYNKELKTEVAELDKKSRELVQLTKSDRSKLDQLKRERKSVENKSDEVEKMIANLEKEISYQTEAVADARKEGRTADANRLNAEIQKTRQAVKDMQAYNAKLANISARLAV